MNSLLENIWTYLQYALLFAVMIGIMMMFSSFFYNRLVGKIDREINASNLNINIKLPTNYQGFKRLFDVVFSLIVITFILSWLSPILWLCIKIDSKGPVFIKHKRIGLGGNIFWAYKFRVVRISTSNEQAIFAQSKLNDDRITNIGKYLKLTGLEKFPMFFNVLLGEMTTVGRSEVFSNEMQMNLIAISEAQKKLLLSIKPGIISLYNISKDNLTFKIEDPLKYDIYYINHQSFIFDLKVIISHTFVLLGLGTKY